MKYRQRPIVVDAVEWSGTERSWNEILEMGDIPWKFAPVGTNSFFIDTLEGYRVVSKGYYVIKGVAGEFYPCEPNLFYVTHEPIENE